MWANTKPGKKYPKQIRVLLNLAVYSGMRKGEILALTWDDIDFTYNMIHVNKTAVHVQGGLENKKPKETTPSVQ